MVSSRECAHRVEMEIKSGATSLSCGAAGSDGAVWPVTSAGGEKKNKKNYMDVDGGEEPFLKSVRWWWTGGALPPFPLILLLAGRLGRQIPFQQRNANHSRHQRSLVSDN